MGKYGTDISPAIQELKKLHLLLLDSIEASVPEQHINKGIKLVRETVISILPGERRREDGWYKWRMWEKRSDDIMHELDPTHKVEKYHEIFVSGEALQGSLEDIVLLMMHQVCHQASAIQSTQSYHSEWIKIWAKRLFKIPDEAWTRDEILGWYNIDKSKLGEAEALVSRLASKLDLSKFDLFRIKVAPAEGTGKMNKWMCGCKHPIVRTGGILRAVCQVCNEPYLLDPRGVRETFLKRVPDNLKRLVNNP